jgi:hypothetical protein
MEIRFWGSEFRRAVARTAAEDSILRVSRRFNAGTLSDSLSAESQLDA